MLNFILLVNFILLAAVIIGYAISSSRERRLLAGRANQSLELQQKVYQTEILREITERIGYSLDTSRIVEILTGSMGSLLEYDAVSYVIFNRSSPAQVKIHIENTVGRVFLQEIREKMLASWKAVAGNGEDLKLGEESVTGNLLDENDRQGVGSFFHLPVVISGKFVALINVASKHSGLYGKKQASILYTIANQAAKTVSSLDSILETEKGKLEAVIYALTDGVVTIDNNFNLAVYNPAVKNILEINSDKVLTLYDIVDALAGKVDLRTKIEQSQKEDKPIFIPDLVLKNKALEVTITPVKDSHKKPIGTEVVFHDITTEKSLEKVRQEFTAMMVHELRAPLTAVRWSSESMIKNLAQAKDPSLDPKKLKDTMLTIETASGNMLELVNDLLDVAKIESGKFELNVQEYDLVETIQAQALAFRPQAEVKHMQILVTAPEKYRLKFDKVRVSQVLSNLLSNAIKYSDAGEISINLGIDAQKKTAIVSIKDSGVGISREDLPDLFSKFKQLKSGGQSRKGTGLGLVVSKGIVEAHGGKIWAESAGENLGSTFSFSLPIN